MAALDDLLKQQADIDKQVADARKAGRKDALQKVKDEIKNYVITTAELKTVLEENDKKTTEKKARAVYPKETKDKALALIKEGKSNSDIGKELDLKTTVIAAWKIAANKVKAIKPASKAKKTSK